MKDYVLDPYNRRGGYLLFFETQVKNKITYGDTHDLQCILPDLSEFRGTDIEPYFKDIMTGKIILSCEDLTGCFTLSPVIIGKYKKKGIEEFMKVYATCRVATYKEENDYYIINPRLSDDEKLSIAYCFYLNNIYTLIDEYTGHFISYKDISYTPIEMEWEDFEEIKE
jgi:hypothetical protein